MNDTERAELEAKLEATREERDDAEIKALTLKEENFKLKVENLRLQKQLAAATVPDGPVYNAGRLEGRADVIVAVRQIVDPEDVYHWNIDGVLKEVRRLVDRVDELERMVPDQTGALAELERRQKHDRIYNAAWEKAVSEGKSIKEAHEIAGEACYAVLKD